MNASAIATVRWCIETGDRIGMVRDVVSVLADHRANVEAMEVVAEVVYVRFTVPEADLGLLRTGLARVPGVRGITAVDRLPFEADEDRLVRRMLQQESGETGLSFASFVYVSQAMRDVVRLASAAARTDLPVLITGESGTGKELLARAVHAASDRRDRRFVPVNCAAIPEHLLESELFGYADGAFTGAVRGGRPGLFEAADGGTLFLDEVAEMNPQVQAKLLRALADGEVRRVGAVHEKRVNVRVVAATNRDLSVCMREGRFRPDLYYRLQGMPLHLPPLRARREDIVPIAESTLARLSRRLGRPFQLSDDAAAALVAYDYPGNIRELNMLLERACLLAEDGVVRPEHLLLPGAAGVTGTAGVAGAAGAAGQTGAMRPSEPAEAGLGHAKAGRLRDLVRAYEYRVIEQAVRECGSLRAAAKRLGVTHTTLSNKLKRRDRDA
ncbi:MAG: sigma 54-interacting transcriptional regulator [Alicyclobacillus macrosporangiidus]|uniref:sigma 54-interacting transcriptional regulator n=1 Tax=Alicyclobacillus macrosporangiidus TaxID=392015 RepID=UPI0026EB4C6F|nr:sigma 54-interacting transcriptional regulator [Alicyclobacillus macrosporangiidus]MCL6599084.1 sigma 54-interacting transcriptional regulator [Alicyclobacillus macrosporangiidus]